MNSHIRIKNKKAYFEYHIVEKVVAGIVLQGTEIKAIRNGRASIGEAYCRYEGAELFVINMHISEYMYGTYNNHEPKRVRKLLLNKKELRKWERKIKERGFSIVPLTLFVNEKGLAKLEIALVTGKKLYDKRNAIKDREQSRDIKKDYGF
jgi:SsrA-binding protein